MEQNSDGRRGQAKMTAAAAAAALGAGLVHAAGSEQIRVGLIGCGARGTAALADCVRAAEGVQVRAVGDLFRDKAERARDKWKLPQDRCFWGFDAYRKVLQTEIDLVILATPPGFRPAQLKAAVEAGKHVFMEKPVAVDPAGVRRVLEAVKAAESKKLALVAGTQRRHQSSYVQTIQRIREGAIGEILCMSVYWNQGSMWAVRKNPGWTDMEWQIRNWQYFTWLGGDHIVEQHVHNLDVANWVMGAHPVSAYGMGGRQVRTDAVYGHIYDHFAVEYIYPGGVRMLSMCRQMENTESKVAEQVVGTKGKADPSHAIYGPAAETFEVGPNSYVQEHADLIRSIRESRPLNEGRQAAESTLTAIMGRMSAYTGKLVSWETAMNSKLDLVPEKLELGDVPIPKVAMPGTESLI